MPPLPPPRGMSTTAVFQVIHAARARTVSIVSCGWNRMPPLQGPRASLYCTRKPWNTSTCPSSIRTGSRAWVSRSGQFSIWCVASSSLRMRAASSSCRWAIMNGFYFASANDTPTAL